MNKQNTPEELSFAATAMFEPTYRTVCGCKIKDETFIGHVPCDTCVHENLSAEHEECVKCINMKVHECVKCTVFRIRAPYCNWTPKEGD